MQYCWAMHIVAKLVICSSKRACNPKSKTQTTWVDALLWICKSNFWKIQFLEPVKNHIDGFGSTTDDLIPASGASQTLVSIFSAQDFISSWEKANKVQLTGASYKRFQLPTSCRRQIKSSHSHDREWGCSYEVALPHYQAGQQQFSCGPTPKHLKIEASSTSLLLVHL